MKTPEGILKDQIKQWLRSHGAYIFFPVQTGYGKRTVDILACLHGRFVAIETKAPGKKPTTIQEWCLSEVRVAGGAAFWCDSYPDFLDKIQRFGFAP